MAEYAERWTEFETSLKETEKIEEFDFKLESLESLGRYNSFRDSLLEYMDWRDRALNDAIRILKDESSSITGDSQKKIWSEYFTDKGQKAHDKILNLVPKDNKTPKLRLFAEKVATQESVFFKNLSQASISWFQGKVQEYTRKFIEEKKKLEGKWISLGDRDNPIDAKIKEACNQVLAIFKDVVQKLAEQERLGETLIRSGVALLEQAPGQGVFAYLSKAAAGMLSKAASYQTDIDSLADEFMDAYQSQETIVILFTETRSAVHTFLNETNLDKAQKELEVANKQSLDMAKGCKTQGQRDDAAEFMGKAMPLVQNMFDKFKDEYNLFVYKNRGRFVGPVSDKTIDELLERQVVYGKLREIESFNIQQKLKDIYNDAVRGWPVDLNGLTDKQKKDLKEHWEVELEKVGRGLTKAADGSAVGRIKEALTDEVAILTGMMKNSKGGEE